MYSFNAEAGFTNNAGVSTLHYIILHYSTLKFIILYYTLHYSILQYTKMDYTTHTDCWPCSLPQCADLCTEHSIVCMLYMYVVYSIQYSGS